MDSVRIKTLTNSATDEVLDLLARAYLTNPIHIAVFGGSGEREMELTRQLFSILVEASLHGNWYAAFDGKQIAGVFHMVRFPDCRPSEDRFNVIIPRLTEVMGESVPGIMEWGAEWAKRDPEIDHWHFGPIAVFPELQKTGIGRLMMQHFCKIADETRTMAYLETDRPENVSFYEKSGFVVTEQGMVLDTPNWFMTRAACDVP